MPIKDTAERIKDSILANPLAPYHRIAKNLNLRVSEVKVVALGLEQAPLPPAASGGFRLGACKVTNRKPADSAARYIRLLPGGKGFAPNQLASEWNLSEDTIRKHAKELGCLKFVEISPAEWIQLVLNPTTAAAYPH